MQVSPSRPREHQAVRTMFDALAPHYDRFNDVLSLRIHHRWRRRAADALAPVSGRRYLDSCAGTLDLACAVAARAPGARVAGADFSLPMLDQGRSKAAAVGGSVLPVAADALELPFADHAFEGCTIGFGLRNLVDYEAGLAEMRRVLTPGGRLVVLEFTTPPGRVLGSAYHAYFHHVLPFVGARIAGDAATARYLPDTVAAFPRPAELGRMMREAGFALVRWRLLTGGIAAIHTGVRE